ncbi:MAG: 7-carboxy-7-deazaguanine synthase QueE [Phycisphaerales bacterium]|nr:7-carboxy-7-deazaguanine synthase QueE [Phycisphaerales bacterium]
MLQSAKDTEFHYPVMEHFYTLQGEGAFAGQAAYFIRLGGCDVGCVWCDVKESWDANVHPKLTAQAIVATARQYPGRIAVVTGGEPSIHNLQPLTDALHNAGFRTHIETAAPHPLSGDWDWITLSPKKFKSPLVENMAWADELKIIIFNKSDFKWAEEYADLVKDSCKLYLQTEWDKREEMSSLIIDFIQQNPRWQLSMQTHKYLNIP